MSRSGYFWQQYGPYLAFGTALTAMLGSLYYSEVAGFVPCTLCWYQRILMYPLSLIVLVGILKQDGNLPDYVLPFSIIGMGVSAYHYLIQVGVVGHSATSPPGLPKPPSVPTSRGVSGITTTRSLRRRPAKTGGPLAKIT